VSSSASWDSLFNGVGATSPAAYMVGWFAIAQVNPLSVSSWDHLDCQVAATASGKIIACLFQVCLLHRARESASLTTGNSWDDADFIACF